MSIGCIGDVIVIREKMQCLSQRVICDHLIQRINAYSFCSCSEIINDIDVLCNCDDGMNVHEWAWDEVGTTAATILCNQNLEVRFHPGYSSGTAAVRGDSPFKSDHVYYWEIKMLTSLYGTDVMVGIGTKSAELNKSPYQFCSLLGSDKESWGFSYTGRLQHNGKSEWYGPPFGKGSSIGIYLDMWKGTLEFFLDRRPLGVAFRSLRGTSGLYPMACSTAAHSAMAVTLSISQPVSLKLLALQALSGETDTMRDLLAVPGLKQFIASSWWLLAAKRNMSVGGGGTRGRKRRGSAGATDIGTDDTPVGLGVGGTKEEPPCALLQPSCACECSLPPGGDGSGTPRRFRRLCMRCDIIL